MAPADEATHTPEVDTEESVPQPAEPEPTETPKEDSPPEKDWKEEYSRLRKDYNSKSSRLKKLEEAVKNEDEPKPEESELDWKIENSPRIKLVKDEYQAELTRLKSAGAKETNDIRLIALERAEQKKGIHLDTSDAERQAAMSGAPGTISRGKTNPVPLTEHDRRFGLTSDRKKELQEKYPELKEEVF